MSRNILTEEEVEREIARLTKSDAVRLARAEQRMKYRRRQQLYGLRQLEKRGKELLALGITAETLEEYAEMENDDAEIRAALHKLGVRDSANVETRTYGNHVKVTVDGEYFGVWDNVRKTFCD